LSGVTVTIESPYHDGVARLVKELDAYQTSLYPAESNHLLDIESLAHPTIHLFVARRNGEALGCGALRIDPEGYGEVKRMFVLPASRGMKVGKQILQCIEERAHCEGLPCLRLETGIHQSEALGLYRSAGFVERSPFGGYRSDPLSVFMEKALS